MDEQARYSFNLAIQRFNATFGHLGVYIQEVQFYEDISMSIVRVLGALMEIMVLLSQRRALEAHGDVGL